MNGIGLIYRNQSAKAETLTRPVGNRVGIGRGPGANRKEGVCHSLARMGKRTCNRESLARSQPCSPLVRSRFLPWLTGSCISNRFHACSLLIILMMEAARTSETSVNFYQTTRRYNPEDSYLRTHHRENLKPY
jgi:hypothetical protein